MFLISCKNITQQAVLWRENLRVYLILLYCNIDLINGFVVCIKHFCQSFIHVLCKLFSMSYMYMSNWAMDDLILTGLFDFEIRIGACIIFYVIVLIMPL